MCLKTVDKKIRNKMDEGWKVFFKYKNGSLDFPYRNWFPEDMLTNERIKDGDIEGIWIKDPFKEKIESESGSFYSCGFHYFKTKHAAQQIEHRLNYGSICSWVDWEYTIRKVFVKNIVATGIDMSGFVTGVAMEMFVCPEGWE